ncbi:MAG: MBL fold metallo-hydrolase [Clostridia bacterium]|nr:MBL fold metallo-hydrolase [Clostridia bacterium]
MIDRIDVFRQNHIRVRQENREIHVDPFRVEQGTASADFILVTHDHSDHFSPSDIARVGCRKTTLVVPERMLEKAGVLKDTVGRIVPVRPGQTYTVDGLELETVPAYNVGKPFHPKSAGWVGYVLILDGQRVYVAGDTDDTPEARAVRCDIALLPIGGTYTMNPAQAAGLANALRPKYVIPVHYGCIVGKEKDGPEFAKRVDPGISVVFKIRF